MIRGSHSESIKTAPADRIRIKPLAESNPSDDNPNRLYWSALVGIGGVGLIPGRSRDNWGVGFYYAAPSRYLIDSLAPSVNIRDE